MLIFNSLKLVNMVVVVLVVVIVAMVVVVVVGITMKGMMNMVTL